MNRREFFTDAGLGGYSLIVSVGSLFGAGSPQRPDFGRIAPAQGETRSDAAEPHMTAVPLEADLLVAGGGLAGVCASLAAARNGAKVILVQDRSRLGGNSSSEVKMHVVGANAHKGRPGWREGGIIEELKLDDAVRNPQRCWELWDLLLYEKVISEPNITLLLDTTVFAAHTAGGRIEEVRARCDRSEHLYRIRAKLFCDCTGDSRLALEAGAEMRWGRESRREFGESLAPAEADRQTQGSSILFTSRQHDRPMPFTAPKWARKVTADQLRFRKPASWEYGYWWIEWGGQHDTVRDNERIRFELLSIVMGVWDYIKNSGDLPESANWALNWVGMLPGRRESRRIVGDHILTQADLMKGDFPDAVAIGGWPMDDHPPGGFDRPDLAPNTSVLPPEVYNIPLRVLYSRNVSNLFVAGRNISASHVAFSSTRVMATCGAVGQAAGTAAALCLRHGLAPRALANDRSRVEELQQTLLLDDQTVRGLRNGDPHDLARSAQIRASAESESTPAANVINGATRDLPRSAANPRTVQNSWTAPLGPDGAWIELSWPQPRRLRMIQFTFDSGFQRELTLSASDSVTRGIVRAPQPETVRDYRVLVRRAPSGGLEPLFEVRGNHQRLNRHRFEAVEVSAVRLHVTATNGDPNVRVFEIRCLKAVDG